MSTLSEKFKTLKRMDTLIQRKATGTPQELAKRLGVSRATIFRYLDNLRELGGEVTYCRIRQSYIYAETFTIIF